MLVFIFIDILFCGFYKKTLVLVHAYNMRKIYMYIIGLAQIIPNEGRIKKVTTAEALPVNTGALR